MADSPSSPPSADATVAESLAWYKNQYEQLALELADFRDSSHELEKELEKDLEAADQRERSLQQRAETLQFQADEWKEKCKQAKTEANLAQNTLEKEITTLRETNRSMQLKLRDIEVANDDFERQARHTTSSLEDMESKYNVAIERAVMMEEEVKLGEQERETLRIDAQRLREELSDLKIEAGILNDKLKKAEHRQLAHMSVISTDISIPESPTFDTSPRSNTSSPLITTPPPAVDDLVLRPTRKMTTASASASQTKAPLVSDPPSPPMSDASSSLPKPPSRIQTPAPSQKKSRLPSMADRSITPKPRALGGSTSGMRPPGQRSATQTHTQTTTPIPRLPAGSKRATSHKIPASTSLTHIRSLTAQMQRLEARVQSARSKLPAPVTTPPRASPRFFGASNGSTNGPPNVPPSVPSTVTIRTRKRTIGSATGFSASEDTPTQGQGTSVGRHISRPSASGVSKLSFGPLPNRASHYDPDSSSVSLSRPSSRASVSSATTPHQTRPERPPSRTDIPRPMSRTSYGASGRTPLYNRPRSSLSGSLHSHSASISSRVEFDELDEGEEGGAPVGRALSRRGTNGADFDGSSSIPAPRAASKSRRQSGGVGPRRISNGPTAPGHAQAQQRLSDLGETY